MRLLFDLQARNCSIKEKQFRASGEFRAFRALSFMQLARGRLGSLPEGAVVRAAGCAAGCAGGSL